MSSALSALAGTLQTSASSSDAMAEARSNVMSAVADELGISQSQLQSKLRSGLSLAQIASAAGISSDQLNATITDALQQSSLPASTNVPAVATRLASHVNGQHHRHHLPTSATSGVKTTTANSSSTASSSTEDDGSQTSTLVDAYL